MTSIYRPILKMAWQIMWRAKYLWFFGLFAVLAANSGEVNLVIDNFSSLSEQTSFLQELKSLYNQELMGSFSEAVKSLFANFNWATLILLILLVALFLFLLWLAIVSQAGLISGAYKEYRKQPSDFLISFKTGRQSFWPVLWINIIGKVIIYGILLIIGLPLAWVYIRQTSETGQLLFTLLSFIILVPLAVIMSFLIKYAVMYAVLKKEKVLAAIKSGWRLFVKNWVVSIEMAILMFLVTILAGIIMLLSAIILTIPLALLLYVFYALQIGGVLMAMVVVALFLFIVLLFWLGALLSTFHTTGWVLLFDRLENGGVFPKIARLIGKLMMKKGTNATDA